jgi:integrase
VTPHRRRGVSGISVYERGSTWSYRIDLGPHPLTGARQRENRGGFATQDEAWTEAIKAKSALESQAYVKPSRRKVRELAEEWLASLEHSVKPTTYENYTRYLEAYVLPSIGDRMLQEVDVTMLNALTRHLLKNGRVKPNTNATMYAVWKAAVDAGKTLTARQLAAAAGVSTAAASRAIPRYKAGRLPRDLGEGLAPKTVRNVLNMLHEMLGDAVAWRYLERNPAEHVNKPRVQRRRPETWTAEQLGAFLAVANEDRFRALWVLVATTGMRRSELAGAERKALDFEAGTLTIEATRVVVDGRAIDGDGKTTAGRRTISLDAYTLDVLREHLAMLDEERAAWGGDYPTHGKLFCWHDGRPIHPDAITKRFARLVDKTGLPKITLHGVRHSYATLAMDAGENPKTLSERIGHASVGFTMQTYVQRSTGRDKALADNVARLIFVRPLFDSGANGPGSTTEPGEAAGTRASADGDAPGVSETVQNNPNGPTN